MRTTRRITTILFFIISLPSVAQNHFIGLKTGANLTNVFKTDFLFETNIKLGFNAAVTYEYTLSEHFSIGTEAQYSQKGFTSRTLFTDEVGNIVAEVQDEFHYDYVSIPIKAGYTFGDRFSGFFNLGIVPSVLFDARYVAPPIAQLPGLAYSLTENVTKFDLGALIEIGANYSVSNNFVLCASLSGQQSFVSITNENYYPHSTVLHSALSLSLGFKYLINGDA